MDFIKRLLRAGLLSVLLSAVFHGAEMSWGLEILVVNGDENGFHRLMKTNPEWAANVVDWPYAMKGGEENYERYLGLIAKDPFLNQSFVTLSPEDAAKRWLADSVTDLVLFDSFAYERDPEKRPAWQTVLMEKTVKSVNSGSVAFFSGRAWPFVEYLADKANIGPLSYDIAVLPGVVTIDDASLDSELARILGNDSTRIVFSAGPCVLLKDAPKARGLVYSGTPPRRMPVAVEFPMGMGRVVYSAFTVEPNLAETAPPQARWLAREMVTRLLKDKMKREGLAQLVSEFRRTAPGMDGNAIDLEGADVQELLFCMGRRFEVSSHIAGDVSLVLFPIERFAYNPSVLGLETLPHGTDGLRILDASLYAPDGRLFGRQNVNGTKIVFRVPASARGGNPRETWTVQLNQANRFSPRTLFMAVFVAESPAVAPGDPGVDPNAHLAYLNFISGDRDPVLRGASNPASVDVFVGKGGRTTYMGGTGENVYTWESEGGHYTIVNDGGKTAPSGVLMIGGPAEPTETVMARSGQNLVITLRDDGKKVLGSVAVKDWFSREGAKLRMVLFEHGPEWPPEEIEWWSGLPNGELPWQDE